MTPDDPELAYIGRIGIGLPVVLVLVAALVGAAIVKPWQGPSPVSSPTSSSSRLILEQPSEVPPAPAAAPTVEAPALCSSHDAWLVVADDVEQGQPVRSWLAADVTYSNIQPLASVVPVTTVVSGDVLRLGLCLPLGPSDPGGWSWSGEVWRQADASTPGQWLLAAVLKPGQGPESAVAVPVLDQGSDWQPGLYLVMAQLPDRSPAWLGVRIDQAGASPGV